MVESDINRNVGHLMTNPAILLKDGSKYLKVLWMLSFLLFVLFMILKIKKSPTGSVCIVKPKMYGPEEVLFTNTLLKS